jgi:uncharacterized protein YggU (UPF0235/DUF167 family)
MSRRLFEFGDGTRGAALAVDVVPMATRNQVAAIQANGTIRVRLMAPPIEDRLNEELVAYLAFVLEVDPDNIELMPSHDSSKKLLAVTNMTAQEVDALVRAAMVDDR